MLFVAIVTFSLLQIYLNVIPPLFPFFVKSLIILTGNCSVLTSASLNSLYMLLAHLFHFVVVFLLPITFCEMTSWPSFFSSLLLELWNKLWALPFVYSPSSQAWLMHLTLPPSPLLLQVPCCHWVHHLNSSVWCLYWGGSKFPYDFSETCHFFAEAFYLLTCFKCFYNSSQNHFYNDYFRIFIANSNVYSSQYWYLLIVLFLWCWQLGTLIVC